MNQIDIKLELPELTAALNRIADALTGAHIAPVPPQSQETLPQQTPVAPPIQQQSDVPTAVQMPLAGTPTAAAPTYTTGQLQEAAGQLMDKGLAAQQQLRELLQKYQVIRVSEMPEDKRGMFALDLRELGVQI